MVRNNVGLPPGAKANGLNLAKIPRPHGVDGFPNKSIGISSVQKLNATNRLVIFHYVLPVARPSGEDACFPSDTKQLGYELLYLRNMAEHLETQYHIEFLISENELIAVPEKKFAFWETSSRYLEHFHRRVDAHIAGITW
ncbi:hypothetical protein SAMN02927914_04425 [Mesorhizobium qingshengii]|uniref:Uncharacterized protein n=1 Tax=Mesorhizobium qingshengii TaxID=1165689 RepID=A0A1G5Z861_9HYPH|nr:hypothetical protein SAMN02927914_04425 [Mesorhizobium qingshengii]